MNTDLFKKKVVVLGEIKKEINGIDEFFAEDRKILNKKKKTLQDAYNGALVTILKTKKEVEGEIEEWVLNTWQKEKELEEETGRIVPSAVIDIVNFSINQRQVIDEIDIDKVDKKYLMVNEVAIKKDRKENESLEISGIIWKTALTLTNTNLGGIE